MKIIILQENLKTALSVSLRAVGASSSLPLLGNLLLKTKQGMLKIYSTNLEIGVVQSVRCKIETEGTVCLPAKLLTDLVANLPEGPLTLELVSGGLKVSSQKSHVLLKVASVDDFPTVSDILPENGVGVEAVQLKEALERVVFAVSQNETQAEICGVLFKIDSESIFFTGTDRYRLAESKLPIKGKLAHSQFNFILPAKAAIEVLKMSSVATTEILLGLVNNQAVFTSGETVITTRLVDGQYPEYEAIVPKEFITQISASKQDVYTALKTLSVFAKGAAGVSVSYTPGGSLIFSAKSAETGEGEVEVMAQISGESDVVLFNHKYILDMLPHLGGQDLVIKLNNPQSPVVFSAQGNQDYYYLVMPIKS